MPIAKLNDIDLYYEDYGKGTPLVLIAGLASDSQSWQPILKDLSLNHRVIIFDNRGVGRTIPQNAKMSIQNISDDCISLIKHLKLSSVSLLGHSMGGFVAMDCAIRYPKYIDKIILAGTSSVNSERNNALFSDWSSTFGEIDSEKWFKNIFYWIFTKNFFKEKILLNDALKFVVEYPYPQTKIGFKHQINAIKEFNCTQKLSQIRSKTLVILGKEDILFPYRESKEALQAITDVEFVFLEQAAHSMHTEQPKAFIKSIQDFLREINTD